MACLWPEADPDTAARDFKVALNTVMKVLEPERTPRHPSRYILRQGTAYYFNLAADFRLDAEEFEQQVRRALSTLAADAAAARTLLRQALAAYQGDYLQGVSLDDWVVRERERLLLLFLDAATTLARSSLEAGDWQEGLAWADAVLARDSCREEAYRLQMTAHHRAGNQALVARTYHTCQEVLEREFGVPPSALTTRLYQRLVRGPHAN
jgi:DNA-binding SARP family transcriptional activator